MIKVCPRCGFPRLKEYTISPSYYEPGYIPEVQCQRCCYHCTHEELRSGTVFNQITQSPETLAEKLVYVIKQLFTISGTSRENPGGYEVKTKWFSTIVDGDFDSEPEAIAATVAKLKEVEK